MKLRRKKMTHPDWWGKQPEPIPWVLVQGPIWPEPWRDHINGDQAFLVRRDQLSLFAQPNRMEEIIRNTERLDWVRSTMATEGVHEPLQVSVDNFGVIVLADGHHRLIVASQIGMPELPVYITVAERSRVGCHVREVLQALLRVR